MGKKRRILFAALPVIVFAILAWTILGSQPAGPAWQGKTLNQYLEQAASNRNYSIDNNQILDAVSHMGPAAIPPLRYALRRPDSFRERSLVFLHTHLPQNLARRLPATNSPWYFQSISGQAARCLAVFGPQARVALPDLIASFDRGLRVANFSVSSIMTIGPQPENLPQLLSLMKSTNSFTPTCAAICIALIGITNQQVFDVFSNHAAFGDQWSRRSFVTAIGQFGPKAAPLVPVLTRNLQDSNFMVRIASAEALWQIQPASAPPVAWFVKELDGEINRGNSPSTITNALGEHELNLIILSSFLAKQGTNACAAIPLLLTLRDDPNIRLRLAGSAALWKINRDTNYFVPIHYEAITTAGNFTPQIAAKELMDYCLEQRLYLPTLEAMLERMNPAVAVYGARAIWKLKGETSRTIPPLAKALNDHITYGVTPEIRQLAADTLAEMGTNAKPATPALLLALSDPFEKVRLAATNALKQIDPAALNPVHP